MKEELERLKRGFDVRSWLDYAGVKYALGGDNTTRGWASMPCIFCHDHANHLGVNLRGRYFHCWLCGETGDVVKLVQAIEGLSFPAAKVRLEDFQGFGEEPKEESAARRYDGLLPKGTVPIVGEIPAAVRKYLERRRFGESILRDYGLMWCPPGGEFPLRLIVPIYLDGELVSWQAADVTGRASRKYVSCADDRALVPKLGLIYGIDDVADSREVVLVEGVTDRWRVGKRRCMAFLGKAWDYAHTMLLKRKVRGDCLLTVMLDPDAHDHGMALGKALGLVHERVRVVLLEEDGPDPAELGEEEVEGVFNGT